MSEELEVREIDYKCDCCLRPSVKVRIWVDRKGKVVLLCGGCEKFLRDFCERHDLKWVEIWF